MSEGLDPKGPAQPSQQSGLNQSQNPAEKTSEEESKAQEPSDTTSKITDTRSGHDVPSTHQSEATSTSMGYGDRGPLKEKDISESKEMNYSNSELEGEQMRAAGEGDVARAVQEGGGGGHGEQDGLTADIEEKTDAHRDALHERGQKTGVEMEEDDHEDWSSMKADVGEALSGRDSKIVLAPEN